ncbi:MAG: hypothetical protein ACFB0E_19990 [Leptolyngbyaceae cyanobacterium]
MHSHYSLGTEFKAATISDRLSKFLQIERDRRGIFNNCVVLAADGYQNVNQQEALRRSSQPDPSVVLASMVRTQAFSSHRPKILMWPSPFC